MSMKFREEMCKECNIQAAKSALFAVNASFLLNGSAATAMLAKGMICSARWCGFGALVAIICLGLTYLTMLGIAEGWKPSDMPQREYRALFGLIKINSQTTETYRATCFYLWIVSLLLFVAGIVGA